jgi:hypothetical protein
MPCHSELAFFSLQSDNWNGGNVTKRNKDINVSPNPISTKNDKWWTQYMQ